MKEHLIDYINTSKTKSVRGLRILLEYFYALEKFDPVVESNLHIVSVFGSARSEAHSQEYRNAKKLGTLLYKNGYAVVTGGSFGIMQAANEGVADGIIGDLRKKRKWKDTQAITNSAEYLKQIHRYSVGLKISLPFEPVNNPFVGASATFHYFMVRKFFFGTLSSAFIACEGGWGTRDELFEMLTLVQTGKAPLMPIIYISPDPEHLVRDIEYTVKKRYISPEDCDLLEIVSDYRKAVTSINRFYSVVRQISYDTPREVDIALARDLSKNEQKDTDAFIRKNLAPVCKQAIVTKRHVVLKEFNYKSYGYIKKLVEHMAG